MTLLDKSDRIKKIKLLFVKKNLMADHTKMIIITSDENIIRQFTLENNKQTNSTTETNNNNNNIISLDFLAHLSTFVCILYFKYELILKIIPYRLPVMIKYINEQLNHLNMFDQNLQNYKKNQSI